MLETFNFRISIEDKQLVMLVTSKLLQVANEATTPANDQIVSPLITLAEKIIISIDVPDISLTRDELLSMHSINMMVNGILTGRDPLELSREHIDELQVKPEAN